jgi:3-oxoacyl-[acyl-carrier-protein] synthase III
MGIGIVATGKYIPSLLKTNEEIEVGAKLAPGTIKAKTGIASRFICNENETASAMSIAAALDAFKRSNKNLSEVGIIICATFTGDYRYPALACKVQKELGIEDAACFDVMANCAGFQVAMTIAEEKLLLNSEYKLALVIGVARQSPFIQWSDPSSAMYFGDGAGAALLAQVPNGFGFLASDIFSRTEAYESVRLRGGGSSFPLCQEDVPPAAFYYEINGLDVWKQFVKYQPVSIRRVLKKANLAIDEIDIFLFHQANLNLIEFFLQKMRVDRTKAVTNVEKYGNTAEASIALVLNEANEQGRLETGTIVLVSGVGAGFTFGSSIIRWYNSG